jgi:CubicO group peptidase (beta-lactamase class C family)
MYQRRFIFDFLVVPFLAVCLLLVISFFSTTLVAAEENRLIQQLERIKKQTGIGAVSYALVENNKVITTAGIGAYGLDNDRLVTQDSLFRVGSITKTFTALAVMHLVEQGKLQLDQAVKTIARDLPLHNPWPKTPVTLAMLLEHTAGLQDLTREEFNYPDPLSLQAALNLKPEARQLHWPPGYHYVYSNLGAGYVGRVIETVTQEDYDNWFEREILAALGMQDSQLHWTKKLEQNLVTGYDSDLKTKIPYWHTLFRPFGGLNTTASDMAKFLLLFTNESEPNKNIILASSIKRMETTETSLAARAGLKTGYGLGIRSSYYNGHRIYGHGGDGDGYLAEFAYSKESHRAYFVVINAFRHDILDSFTGLLNNWLIEELPEGEKFVSQSRVKALTNKKQQALVGQYREVTQRFPFHANTQTEILRIKNIDNKLFRCLSGKNSNTDKCTKIFPVTDVLFRTEEEQHASMAFIKAPDGDLYLQTGFGNYQKIGVKNGTVIPHQTQIKE